MSKLSAIHLMADELKKPIEIYIDKKIDQYLTEKKIIMSYHDRRFLKQETLRKII